jgi:exopolysaccharide production protein ExoZ
MLRAIAASMVFVYHSVGHYEAMGGQSFIIKSFSSFGFAGVDIFFVISGFVAAHTTWKRERTFAFTFDFLRRRVLRIYLGYWPFWLLALSITFHYAHNALAELDLAQSLLLTTLNIRVLPLPVTWSLSYEMVFYGLIAVASAVAIRSRHLVASGVFCALLVMVLVTVGESHSSAAGFLAMLLEFVAGYLLYVHHTNLNNRAWIVPLGTLALLAFAVGAHLHATNDSVRTLSFGLGALLFVALAVALELTHLFTASASTVKIGNASYTLYLAHLPAISLFFFTGASTFLASQSSLVRDAGFVLFLLTTLWCSKQIYERMEAPLYQWVARITAFRRPAHVAPES